MANQAVEEKRPDPANIEVEQALLGAIFVNNDAYHVVSAFLLPEHFAEPLHGAIFKLIATTVGMGRPATPVTLKPQLDAIKTSGITNFGGVWPYVVRLVGEAVTVANASDYGRTIVEYAARRALLRLSERIRDESADTDGTVEGQIESAEGELGAIRRTLQRRAGGAVSVSEGVEALIERAEAVRSGEVVVPGTGLTDLDKELAGGLHPGRLIVVGGRPGMGKTVLLTEICRRVAVKGRREERERGRFGAIFVTLEVDASEVSARVLAGQLAGGHWPLAYRDIMTGKLSDSDYTRLRNVRDQVEGLPLIIEYAPGASLPEIAGRVRLGREKLRREGYQLGVVAIDYLGLVASSERYRGNRVNELGETVLGAKRLAEEVEATVLLGAQLSRKVEDREPPRPTLADLRDCLPGSALVTNAETGERETIAEIVRNGRRFSVLSVGPDWKISPHRIIDAWSVGTRKIFKLTTRLGREIRASGGHRFLVADRWLELRNLTVGSVIGLPRSLPSPVAPRSVEVRRAVLLGWLIGDGYLGGTAALTVEGGDDAALAVDLAATEFGIEPRVMPEKNSKTALKVVMTTGHLSGAKKNPLTTWLREIGAWGSTGAAKAVPEAMMTADNAAVAGFLRGLFHADGTIVRSGKAGGLCVRLVTVSRQLASGVQYLLLRFGLNAKVRGDLRPANAYRKTSATMWSVQITGMENVGTFVRTVGFLGRKQQRAVDMVGAKVKTNDASQMDRMPLEINSRVNAARKRAGVTVRSLGWCPQGKRLSRSNLERIASRIGDVRLLALARSDVIWDEVASIEEADEEECFDLQVPGVENFVVDGFLTHNSGNIEEHADSVILLYREVVYLARKKKQSEEVLNELADKAHSLELILDKNRIGGTSIVRVYCDVAVSRVDNHHPG